MKTTEFPVPGELWDYNDGMTHTLDLILSVDKHGLRASVTMITEEIPASTSTEVYECGTVKAWIHEEYYTRIGSAASK